MKAELKQYIAFQADRGRLSESSILSYERDLHALSLYLEAQGVECWDAVQRHHLSRFIHSLKEQGRKAATISRHIVSIRAFFQYMLTGGHLSGDPSIYLEAPRWEKKPPAVLTEAETNALLEAPDPRSPAGKRDKAMLELLYATGIRVSELVSLNLEHMHMTLGYIQCTSGMKERIVPFGRHAAAAVEVYLNEGRDGLLKGRSCDSALFLNHLGTRMTRQGFWKMLKKYAREADIGEEITPHTMRHSVAAHLLDHGADARAVQELMGHADIATTLKYLQGNKARLKEVYTGAHPRA
ncbi:tyrosine recombinase XerD [Paenibacillus sp. J5C_2022]|uniref:site-specific tyrosine recombinase n=1 Tax=Paenibacillus sp. J5C2022 TaxID=2977129 RepID=UPI0021D27570|nr:site-specific tyrosine recombinase [Paenibacillus sp. J5C2022]MCU6710104.1 tyrosine recombinase XerD [Paenibacillus sp. J5C2022]